MIFRNDLKQEAGLSGESPASYIIELLEIKYSILHKR